MEVENLAVILCRVTESQMMGGKKVEWRFSYRDFILLERSKNSSIHCDWSINCSVSRDLV